MWSWLFPSKPITLTPAYKRNFFFQWLFLCTFPSLMARLSSHFLSILRKIYDMYQYLWDWQHFYENVYAQFQSSGCWPLVDWYDNGSSGKGGRFGTCRGYLVLKATKKQGSRSKYHTVFWNSVYLYMCWYENIILSYLSTQKVRKQFESNDIKLKDKCLCYDLLPL